MAVIRHFERPVHFSIGEMTHLGTQASKVWRVSLTKHDTLDLLYPTD